MRLLVLIFLFLLTAATREEKITIVEKASTIERLSSFGMKFPRIFLCQVFLETKHLTSKIYLDNNNLVGMKLPRMRPTTAVGVNRGHAVYITAADSIQDYILWQQEFSRSISKCNNDMEYLAFISTFYAEDPDYQKKILKIYNKTFNNPSFLEEILIETNDYYKHNLSIEEI